VEYQNVVLSLKEWTVGLGTGRVFWDRTMFYCRKILQILQVRSELNRICLIPRSFCRMAHSLLFHSSLIHSCYFIPCFLSTSARQGTQRTAF
jgi:hypothetical protein